MSRVKTRIDLAGHMAECDANYVRMRRLLPTVHRDDERAILLKLPAGNEQTLLFRVVDRNPYTTDVDVSFRAQAEGWSALLPPPRLCVRMYHDARSAEVIGYQSEDRFRGRYDYPNPWMHQPDEKIQLNRFLGEYLSLCLEHGCDLEPVALI